MVKVMKKGGKLQTFKVSKIQRGILKAAKGVVYQKEAKFIARKVSASVSKAVRGKKVVNAKTLRKMVLAKVPRAVASSWRKYDKRRK